MSKRKHQIEAYFRQAQQLHASGRLPEADHLYRQLLAAVPNHADSLHMLGVIALQTGHPEAALNYFDQAITQRPPATPAAAPIHAHRAHALLALRRPDDALAAAERGLHARRNCAEAAFAMGHALIDLGRPAEAIAAYQNALRHNPALPDLANSLALALLEANRLDEARTHLEAVVRRQPGDIQARNNLAGVLRELGQLNAAEAMYRAAIQQAPNEPLLHENLAIVLLLAGHLADGWAESEWRWRRRPELAMGFTQPRWEGEPLNGRTLLIHAEQGIGSNIQFCRYLAMIPSKGHPEARIILAVQPSLVRLMRSLRPEVEVVAFGDPLPSIDLRCPMLSLPRVLGTNTVEDIPADIPYLRADPAAAAHWRRRIEALPGLRVGLAWAGNPEDIRMDRRRSMPITHMAPLRDVPGVSLVSLQVGDAARQLANSPLAGAVQDWTADLADFADTAALIEALDLVIAVDTAVVHLAGALGKPVWLLNRFDTCWRWLLGRDDSPWYPTLRQFRQPTAGDWPGVIQQIQAALNGS